MDQKQAGPNGEELQVEGSEEHKREWPHIAIQKAFNFHGRSLFSIIYTPKDEPDTVLKAGAVWFKGEDHGRAPLARLTERDLRREARLYEAIGPHERITKLLGLEVRERGVRTVDPWGKVVEEEDDGFQEKDTNDYGPQEAWALRLERAPHGSVREYIVYSSPTAPDMRTRLGMCVDFAEGMAYLHEKGVVWGDVSACNALLFDGLRVKLCDFAGSILRGVYDELAYGCEMRYCPPGPDADHPEDCTTVRDLFGLGSAICEITEWAVPYGPETDLADVGKALDRGEWPEVSVGNPAGNIIQRCWAFGYGSAGEVVDALKTVMS